MKKPKRDSKPPSAPTADDRTSPAAIGAEAPVNDAPPEPKPAAEAAETTAAAASGASAAGQAKPTLAPAAVEFVTLAFPLPEGAPSLTLETTWVVVKAKAERGRWRAGRQFTREETVVPLGDLSEQQFAALTGDAELIVSLRLPKPA